MWLLAAGLEDVDPTQGPRFTMENMAIQAALDGQRANMLLESWAAGGSKVEDRTERKRLLDQLTAEVQESMHGFDQAVTLSPFETQWTLRARLLVARALAGLERASDAVTVLRAAAELLSSKGAFLQAIAAAGYRPQ